MGTFNYPLWKVLTFLIFSVLLHVVHSQKHIPTVDDPFSRNPEPEPVPTTQTPLTGGCPEAFAKKLNEAFRTITDLERKVNDLNITVSSRVNMISQSSSGATGTAGDLANRVTRLESYLQDNVTSLTNQLKTDLSTTTTSITKQLGDVRYRLASIQSGGAAGNTGGDNGVTLLYANISQRLDNLENIKVQTLIEENNVWRKNFEVVNKTFAKLKKSSYSNEVIVMG